MVDDNVGAAESTGEYAAVAARRPRGPDGLGWSGDPRRREGLSPDVGLLDLGLPGLDGHAVAARLRARPGRKIQALIMANPLSEAINGMEIPWRY